VKLAIAMLRRICERIPNNLAIFVAAVLLSNAVNLFSMVYGADSLPLRSRALLISSGASFCAAALWTALATKMEQIEKTVASSAQDAARREQIREELWVDVWRRVGAYLCLAVLSSAVAIAALVVPAV
jgi:hypothetical protein